MTARKLIGLGIATAVALGLSGAGQDSSTADPEWQVVVRDGQGERVAQVPLGAEGFAVSYRNSIYGTVAEERYRTLPDGSFRLSQVAADQLAVLEEYYALDAPSRAQQGDRRAWVSPPAPDREPVFQTLSIAATDLGERTLLVPGEAPVQLWRLVQDGTPYVELDLVVAR